MQKICRFVLETSYGAFVGWCTSGLVALLFGYVFGPYRSLGWLVWSILAVHASLGLVVLAAVFYSLAKRRWLRALGQCLLGGVSAALFVTGLVFVAVSLMFSNRNYEDFKNTEQPWYGTLVCEQLPFAVEYQAAHPFLAEYNKRIVFKSGKRIGINVDTGGAGDFAVYALEDGRYYLVDGLRTVWIRSEYRVDPEAESVERKCGRNWLRIPDGSLFVDSWSDDSLTVKTGSGAESVSSGQPVKDSLKDKRFIGMVTTKGKFVPGGTEPEIEEDKVTWTSSKIDDTVPFAYQWGESLSRKSSCRFAFKSGKTVGVQPDWRRGDHSIYRLKDGRFLFASQEGTIWETLYRIDVANEVVWLNYNGHWFKVPCDTLDIVSMTTVGARSVIEIETETGKTKVYGDERAGSVYLGATYIGRMNSKGALMEDRDTTYESALARTQVQGTVWTAEVELDKLAKLYEGIFNSFKADREAFKKRAAEVPGWFVSFSGKAGHKVYRVYHAGDESCVVSMGLEGDTPQFVIQAAGRSRNLQAARYAAAIAAFEELKALAK